METFYYHTDNHKIINHQKNTLFENWGYFIADKSFAKTHSKDKTLICSKLKEQNHKKHLEKQVKIIRFAKVVLTLPLIKVKSTD